MWEGETRVDLVQAFAGWAEEHCTLIAACEGVCCCLVPAVAGGAARAMPVSDDHPLSQCRHFVAAVPMAVAVQQDTTSLAGFYISLGLALLGTVMDGDCGIDTMCLMAGLPQTLRQREIVREERALLLNCHPIVPWKIPWERLCGN